MSLKPEQLSAALLGAAGSANRILESARERMRNVGTEEFIKSGVGGLGKLISVYNEMFSRVGRMTRKEVDQLCKTHWGDVGVRDAFEEFISMEESWDGFLLQIDKQRDHVTNTAHDDDDRMETRLLRVPLLDARTGKETSLLEFVDDKHLEDIKRAKGLVIVISFGTQEGAQRWLAETASPFIMLLDKERKVYSYLGLKTSIAQVWNVKTLTYYAEQKREGRKLHSLFSDDDPNQMGGDFIIGNDGQLALSHRSETPTDRPTANALLKHLQGLS